MAVAPDAETMRQRRLLWRERGLFALAAAALLFASIIGWFKIPDPRPPEPRVELAMPVQDRMLVDALVLRYLELPSVRQSGGPTLQGLSDFLGRFAGPAALPPSLLQAAAQEAMDTIGDIGVEAFRQWLEAKLARGRGGGDGGGAGTEQVGEPGGGPGSCTTNVYLCDRAGRNCGRRECTSADCPPEKSRG